MRAPLISLYSHLSPALSASSLYDLLSLPLLESTPSERHLTLISTYLLYALTIALHTATDIPGLLAILYDSTRPTLLLWASTLSGLPDKQHDHTFTRAYTLTSRYASSLDGDPASAYSLRIYSLLCLARTRPSVIAANTFWEQAIKFTAAFANTGSVKANEGVKTVLDGSDRIAASVEQRQDSAEFMSGQAFVRFCEYWSRFAKQVRCVCEVRPKLLSNPSDP